MDKKLSWMAIGLVIGIVLGGIGGYLVANNIHRIAFQEEAISRLMKIQKIR